MSIEITNVLKTANGLVFKFYDETSLAFYSLGNLTSIICSTDINIMAYLNEVSSYLKSKNIKEPDNPVIDLERGKSKSEIEFYDSVAVAIADMQSYLRRDSFVDKFDVVLVSHST